MAVIGNISIRMAGDANPFVRELGRSIEALEEFEAAATRTQRVADGLDLRAGGGNGGGTAVPAADTGRQAAEISAALSGAMAPLAQIGTRIESQLNRVGGTIVTLARRLDSSIKFPGLQTALASVQQSLNRLSPAASRAVGGLRGFLSVRNWIQDLGDVAGRPLDRLRGFSNLSFARPIASAREFTAQMSRAAPVIDTASTSAKNFGREVLVAFGVFGLGFKVVQFFREGIAGASNLNESVNKMGLIFQDQSGTVGKAADDMAARFGVVKTSFIDTASQFGQLLQGMGGQTQAASAKTSAQLTKLAADASSTFNVSFEAASEKIAAALRGQSEPISAFGIDTQEAAVKQEALRMGLIRAGQEMTTQQKVAARTALVIRGLAVAEGDLARTADAPANAFRRFQGTIKNVATSLGNTLLPVVQKGLGLLNEFAAAVQDRLAANQAAIDGFVSSVSAGFDTLAVVVRNFPDSLEIVKLKFLEWGANLLAVVETIPANLGLIADYIAGNWRELIVDGVTAVGSVFQNLGTNLGNLWVAVQSFLAGEGFNFEWTPLLDGFKATAAKLPEIIKPELVSFQDQIDAVGARIAERETARMNGLAKNLAPAAKGIAQAETVDTKGVKPTEFAGAFQLGSSEAYSQLLQFRGAGNRDDGVKEVATNTKQQVGLLKDIKTALTKPGGAAGQPMQVMAF